MAEGTVAGTTIYRVTVHGEVQQQKVQFGWHMRQTAFLDATDAADALPLVKTWIDTNFRPACASSTRILRTEVQEITSGEYANEEYVNAVGLANVEESPSFVAYLISLRSAKRQRHRNGRMYWFNATEGAISQSTITQAAMTSLQGVVDAWVAEFAGAALAKPFKAVIVAQAREASPTRPAIEHSWIDVDSVRIANYVSHQVRRKIGRGA